MRRSLDVGLVLLFFNFRGRESGLRRGPKFPRAPGDGVERGFFWRFATRSGHESDGVALLLRTASPSRARLFFVQVARSWSLRSLVRRSSRGV